MLLLAPEIAGVGGIPLNDWQPESTRIPPTNWLRTAMSN